MKDKHCWPYVAGIMDGEGSFSISHNKSSDTHQGRITIGTTSFALIEYLMHNFGGKFYSLDPSVLHGFNRKTMHSWRLSGIKNKEAFVLGALPHLVIKKEQAKVFLEFLRIPRCNQWSDKEKVKSNYDLREGLRQRLSFLNRGSKSVTTNTQELPELGGMIESDLIGDNESDLVVTQEVQ